jgi:hypothetical protein
MKRTRSLSVVEEELHDVTHRVHTLTAERDAHPDFIRRRASQDLADLEEYLSPWLFAKLVTNAEPGNRLASLKIHFDDKKEWSISLVFEDNRTFYKCVTLDENHMPLRSSLGIPREQNFRDEEELWATYYVENYPWDKHRDVTAETLAAIALAAWCSSECPAATNTTIQEMWDRMSATQDAVVEYAFLNSSYKVYSENEEA